MCVHPCLPALQAALPGDPLPARGCAVHRLCWHRAWPPGCCCITPLSCLPGAELTAARQLPRISGKQSSQRKLAVGLPQSSWPLCPCSF